MAGIPLPGESSDSDQSEDEDPTATPERELLWASAAGDLAAVKRLIKEHREVINTTDRDLYTPLHRAAYSNNNIILKLLLHYGGNVSSRTVDGWTALHSACRWGNLECVRPLVRANSAINALTNSGQTPLHLAASEPQAHRTLKYLLRQPSIAKDLVNSVGDSARDIAGRCGPYSCLFDTVQQKPLELLSPDDDTNTGEEALQDLALVDDLDTSDAEDKPIVEG